MVQAPIVESFEALASMFKGLAEPARLKVLLSLSEKCRSVGAIVDLTGLSQPTVSRHLRALRAETLVRGQRVGVFVYYWLEDEAIREIVEMGEQVRRRLVLRAADSSPRPVAKNSL